MIYHTFGRTGLRVSALGYGAAPAGYLGVEQQTFTDIIKFLLDSGINVIDTAECYPGAEEGIGNAFDQLKGQREKCIIISKCGHAVEGDTEADWSVNLLRHSIDRSLKRMKTDRIEVMLLHSCGLDLLKKGDVLKPLAEAKQAGKVRFIGYSGDNEAAEYAANLPEIDVIEASINICDQHNIERVLPVTQKNNLGVIAKRPIANAAWKPLSDQEGIYVNYARTYAERFTAMNLKLHDLQAGQDASWADIALRFTVSTPGVHTSVVGSTKTANLQANINALQRGGLPSQSVDAIRQAFKYAERASATRWDGQT